MNVSGKIALIRYGKLFRGSKAKEAQKRGAIGVILYSDPGDYGPLAEYDTEHAFPNANYLPPDGVQRFYCSSCFLNYLFSVIQYSLSFQTVVSEPTLPSQFTKIYSNFFHGLCL